jgi:hypothetical protein
MRLLSPKNNDHSYECIISLLNTLDAGSSWYLMSPGGVQN